MYPCFSLAETVMDLLCLSQVPVTVKQGCCLGSAGFCRTRKNFQICLKNWSLGDSHRNWHCAICLLIYRVDKLYLFGLLYIFSIKDISCRLYFIPVFLLSMAAHLGTSAAWLFFPVALMWGKMLCPFSFTLHPRAKNA